MKRRKREKGYWEKRTEYFTEGPKAKERAGMLRMHEHVAHVTVDKQENALDSSKNQYVVAFSVAKWYLEDLNRSGVKL